MGKKNHTVALDDEIWAKVIVTAQKDRRGIGQQLEYLLELGFSVRPDDADATNLQQTG